MAEYPPQAKPTAPNPVQRAIETAENSAAQAIGAEEECISEHPASSVATSFIGGLLIGTLIGWAVAESRHHTYRNACRELAAEWTRRLRLD